MMHSRTSLPIVALVAALVACHGNAKDEAPRADAAAPGPTAKGTLVVTVVVDQFAAWIASDRVPLLPKEGGFARLLREGTYVRDLRYVHAATDTAPGHAALYTGAPPRGSGIWSNDVIDPASHNHVSSLWDPKTKVVSTGSVAWTGSSTTTLATETLADRLHEKNPNAVVVSVSIKDRGAIFGGGRTPTHALWFDRSLDRFVTSTAFASTFPPWADALAAPQRGTWNLLDPAWTSAHSPSPDAQLGEGNLGGLGIVFPHDVAHAENPALAFIASPFADDAVIALGLAGLDAHASENVPKVLALSLSANDYIGHTFGPDSWESWDELRRLDASLAKFFAALDARFGSEGWSIVLAADHGVMPMPEAATLPNARPWCADPSKDRWQRPCGEETRVLTSDVTAILRDAAWRSMHRDDLILGTVDPYVYFTTNADALPKADRAKLVKVLLDVLAKRPEVERAIDTATLPAACAPDADESLDALACRSFVPNRAGAIYIALKSGAFFDPGVVEGKGTGHGSPWIYDRSVPLFVRAPGRAKAGAVVEEETSFRSFARTAATLLGVEPSAAEAASARDFARP